jgi:uncharacterized surface protein with fasciclin (FAS1) repeats
VLATITHLPGTFSTLELGLTKTGVIDALNKTDPIGLTLFAPTNFAFKRLGPRINAFLFSKIGQKYLKALLEYHIVPDKTLYSTAYTPVKKGDGNEEEEVSVKLDKLSQTPDNEKKHTCAKKHNKKSLTSKAKSFFDRWTHQAKDRMDTAKAFGHVHIDLPTLLADHPLAIDIFRHGPFVNIRINAVVPVTVQDGLAADGVIHVVPRVLIPPRKPGGKGESVKEGEEEMSLEEFVERLEPFVEKDGDESEVVIEDGKWEF